MPVVPQKINCKSLLLVALIISSTLVFIGITNVYGVGTYSKDDTPFGSPLDVWLNKWWSWWISTTGDDVPPKSGGCLANTTGSMVMLMETAVTGKPHQVCNISSSQGIVVPLWTAFWEASTPENMNKTYQELSKLAREQGDIGAITSLIKVDGVPVAKLDVVSSLRGGSLDYKINAMNNVTELFSKGFNITIPENTWRVDQNTGTWRSGAHGWFAFLKPLPTGDHTLYYNVGVTGTGPNDHSAEITYDLKVK